MDNIVLNMKGTEENQGDTVSAKRLEEDRRLIDEINGKIAACEKELDEIPEKIDELNRTLMLETMDYCYRDASPEGGAFFKEVTGWNTL